MRLNRIPKSFVPGPAVVALGFGSVLTARLLPSVGAERATVLVAVAALLVGLVVGRLGSRARSGRGGGPSAVPAGAGPRFVPGEPYVLWGPPARQERWRVVYVWGDAQRIVLGLRPAGGDPSWLPVRWLRMHPDGTDEAAWRDWQRWRVGIQRRR